MAQPTQTSRDNGDVDASNLYIKFPKIWEDYVEVSWGRQLFDGKKVVKYQLAATAKNYRVERFFSGSDSTFRLVGLAPNMLVRVQVRSLIDTTSDGGSPTWNAWASSEVTTLRDAECSVASVSSAFIHGKIKWGSDLVRTGPSSTHAAVAAASLHVKVRERGTFLTSDLCEKELAPDSDEFIIRDVPSSGIFEVSVRAISIYGDVGKWSAPVRYLTLNSVELSLPHVGEDFGVVAWRREEEEKFLPSESAIEELVMIVELMPSQRELDVDAQAKRIQVDAQTFSNEVRKYRLRNLLPGRSYNIRSRYRNSLGDWTQWSSLRFATLSPVVMPDAQIVGHNFLQVTWQRAEPEHREGAAPAGSFESTTKDVKSWEIRCTVGKAQTSMELPPAERETKLVNLLPGVEYSIDVRALTTAGEWGLWSEPLIVTTLHRLKCRAEVTGETWMTVDWNRRDRQYVDSITRYHVQLNSVSSSFRVAKYFPANVTSYTFEGLKPDTPFQCIIQAFSDQRWGPWSEATECRTCTPCAAHLIRRGEDFVQLRWNSDYYQSASVEPMDRKFQLRIHRPRVEDEHAGESIPPKSLVVEETSVNTFRVARLPPYSRITVQVRCYDHSLQAWCDWGPERQFRTLPTAMVVTHIGETTVELSWARRVRVMSGITDESEEAGAVDPLAPVEVLKYIIRLHLVDPNGCDQEVCKYHFDHTMPTTAAITELKPDTNYSLQLSYLDNDEVWSSLSARHCFRTSPLMQITVLDVTEGACALHWGRWKGGVTELPLSEKAFRVVVTRVNGNEPPRQYNVLEDNRYIIRELLPSTVYKIQVAAALHTGSAWGCWSEPAFVFTTPAMETELVQVGEDYCHVAWKRGETTNFSRMFPEATLSVVPSYVPDAPVAPRPIPRPEEGHVVYAGDSQVVEYHVQLFKVSMPPADDPDASPIRELFYEAKLNDFQDNVRIPSLTASTPYEALVSACTKSKQWGCWSTPLEFCTSTPTEVRVSDITQDHIRVVWGNEGAIDRDVWKFQLRIQGHDDEYLREVELESDVTSYLLNNLSVNACYSVRLRRFLSSDKDWGQWSEPVYILIKVVPTEILEVSQDWAHLKWSNKPPADKNIVKVQFLSLLGKAGATVVRLDAETQHHTFQDLKPNTLFGCHLLSIEQSSTYQSIPERTSSPQGSSKSGPKMEMEGNVAPYSIPVVSSDFAAYLNAAVAFRTHGPLMLRVERTGQNFALLRWASAGETADKAEESSTVGHNYEIECLDLDSEPEDRKILKVTGTFAIIRNLKPASNLRFAVRAVAERSEAPCQWSTPIVSRILPMIEPRLGPGDGTDTPGIGEDYVLVHWDNHMASNGMAFEVRLTQLEGVEQETETISPTTDARCHFKALANDTKYRIEVRTCTTLTLGYQITEVIMGEWSVPILCATLSPMAVAVSDIVESSAMLHWRRRNFAQRSCWWVRDEKEDIALKTEIATISSFHVRITAIESGTVVCDEQIADHQESFARCCLPLKALSPATKYAAVIRSSTGMMWGAWSDPVQFQTSSACDVKVQMIGERYVAIKWTREDKLSTSSATVDAVVKHWEVNFNLLGATDTKASQRTVLVDCEQTVHCIGGLDCNTPYNATVRPVYDNSATGMWSTPTYFVTKAPFKVDVGKVGETFVQVSWERGRQETVQTKMRIRHMEVMRAMAAQIEELEIQLAKKKEALQGHDGDDAPVQADELGNSEEHRNDEGTSDGPKRTPIEELAARIEDMQQKMNRRQKLSTLQIADLERATMYPTGEDVRYELIVHGGALEGEEQPFLFRRRLGKGELQCRLEGLQPKTIYEVTVRALFTNGLSMTGMGSTDVGDVVEDPTMDGVDGTPWGPWSDRTRFATLKPIVAKAKSVGSECIALEWDTGGMGGEDKDGGAGSQRTAITKFQLQMMELKRQEGAKEGKQRPIITLEDPSLKGYVIGGLAPNNLYSITVRVCYEGDKWGVWSTPVNFMTMPKLLCKLQSVAERQLEFLLWRDTQLAPPADVPNAVVWKPLITDHQLAINGLPCSQTFSIESSTSTLLTLDTLAIDTEYVVSVKDRVEEYWQDYNVVLRCETVAYAPQRPTLLERKGQNVAITWNHKQSLAASKQYLYCVEMALRDDAGKKEMSNRALQRGGHLNASTSSASHGEFEVLGYTSASLFRMVLPHPVHSCYFRVKVCKTSQTIDGEPQPVTVNSANPQHISMDNPQTYIWSKPSAVAHFKTPSVPDHPTGLCITDLTNNSATLRWKRPENHADHSDLLYRVYLNNSYQERFTCICETTQTHCPLKDLIPNCHYRVAVTAESTMGTSLQNNTLHFSTRVTPNSAEPESAFKGMKKNKPLSSTLPPRTALKAPAEVLEALRNKKSHTADDGGFTALLDDTASTVFTAVRLTQQRRSPPQSADGRPNSSQRPRNLPPLHSDANASI
jgi:hypothetical protein